MNPFEASVEGIGRVTVRKCRNTDFPKIHALVRQLAHFERAEQEVVTDPETFLRDHEAGYFDALVAETDTGILGMALYFRYYSTWKGRVSYLEDLVVEEAYRGKGLGKLLFEAFLAEAKREGACMAKWQVLDWNTPAIDFYKGFGAFVEKGWWNVKIHLT